ncbi:hypothetical protein RHMOL_Rhmol09G0018300 [Rhododendron molle]|uniref:Uncharacterized protein n=1 Tax=Rhododendron molle TaxID=49168 RepID=A0ACC0M9Y4_RHOML|nr:hypothetical protein RHMOL_Rhmol09G0018300 [Rhododendron molle]
MSFTNCFGFQDLQFVRVDLVLDLSQNGSTRSSVSSSSPRVRVLSLSPPVLPLFLPHSLSSPSSLDLLFRFFSLAVALGVGQPPPCPTPAVSPRRPPTFPPRRSWTLPSTRSIRFSPFPDPPHLHPPPQLLSFPPSLLAFPLQVLFPHAFFHRLPYAASPSPPLAQMVRAVIIVVNMESMWYGTADEINRSDLVLVHVEI